MNKIKQSITLILLICCFSNLSGQETLTLEQCRAMALENNKEIAIAAQNKEMAMTSVKSYRANFLPRISAMGLGYYATGQNDVKIKIDDIQLYDPSSISGYIPPFLSFLTPYIDQFSSVSVPDMDFNLKLNNTYMAGVFVEQPVFMGGKITTAYKMSKIGNELSTLSQQLTEAEVIVQTDDAYWLYVKATELHKSATKYKEVLDEFYRMIENAWKGGMKSQNDALKVQVKLNEAELQVLQASNGVRLARMNLCHIIGIPLSSDVPLPETFDEALSGINREAGITTRPEYAMLNKQIEFKDRQVKLVRSDFLPNIGVSGGYSYAYGMRLNNEPLMNSASFSAVVSVKIPLFHWGEGAYKIRMANYERKIAEMQRDELSEKMQLELMQALNIYEEAAMEVALTTRSLEQAEENLRVSRNHYEAGMTTLAEHLEAQTLWQKASSDLINAKAKMKLSETRYLKASGTLTIH